MLEELPKSCGAKWSQVRGVDALGHAGQRHVYLWVEPMSGRRNVFVNNQPSLMGLGMSGLVSFGFIVRKASQH